MKLKRIKWVRIWYVLQCFIGYLMVAIGWGTQIIFGLSLVALALLVAIIYEGGR